MIRLMLRLLGIRDYEVCKSCETLIKQLEFERAEKKQLTDTLLKIVSPKTYETPPVEVNPVAQTSTLFSRRRAALEAADRESAKIVQSRERLAVPDDQLRDKSPIKFISVAGDTKFTDIDKLETELGIGDDKTQTGV